MGSGRSECVRAIFGADHVTGGSVKVDGKADKIKKPLDAMKQGVGYLPEDRKGDGIVGDLSVRENIILALQVMKGFFRRVHQAAGDQDRLGGHAHQVPLRRQPAEVHLGPVASHRPQVPHSG